jgi:hypothetical protein
VLNQLWVLCIEKTPPTFLDNDLDFGKDFKDSVLMGLDSIDDADLNGIDEVMNPFDFKWPVAPLEVFSTICTGSLETVLHKTDPLGDYQLVNSCLV